MSMPNSQRNEGMMFSKGNFTCKKGKTLKGKSQERWGMKKDPKVLIKANR